MLGIAQLQPIRVFRQKLLTRSQKKGNAIANNGDNKDS
jgi:hypothetical protein